MNYDSATGSNMDGPRDQHHTKWSKSEREKQTPYQLLYVESKMTQMNVSKD